jgi:hypothetical protein
LSIFRRGEPLHVRLAREAGIETGAARAPIQPSWREVGIHGVPRPRRWDAVVAADVPPLGVGELEFAALPDGTLVVDDSLEVELEPGSLDPFAVALEAELERPYRAQAVWRGGSSWGVAGRQIEVAELPEAVSGDEILLSVVDGERSLTVDGLPSLESVPALERLGEARGDSYVIRAERLADNLWEVQAAPL